MADKDTQRNVRSSTKEAFQTPTQKHFHSLSEKGNVYFGKHQKKRGTQKGTLLEKFKEREMKQKEKSKEPSEQD